MLATEVQTDKEITTTVHKLNIYTRESNLTCYSVVSQIKILKKYNNNINTLCPM